MGVAHESEFDGEPEEAGHSFDVAGDAVGLLGAVGGFLGDGGGGAGGFSEPDEGVGEGAVGVHGDMAGDVVEDVGFGEVVEVGEFADGDGGGEIALAEAVEKLVGGDVSADGFGAKTGEGV